MKRILTILFITLICLFTSVSADEPTDIYKAYYKNGELWFVVPIVNGKKHGTYKEYYETGELESEVPYVNGEKHGVGKRYYRSGILEYESLYKNGKLLGTNKYDVNGNIMF